MNCYHIIGFPLGHRFHKGNTNTNSKARANHITLPSIDNKESSDGINITQEQCQQLLTLLNNASKCPSMAHHVGSISKMSHLFSKALCLSSSLEHIPWILDNGATDQMVCLPSYLTTSVPVHDQTIKLPLAH